MSLGNFDNVAQAVESLAKPLSTQANLDKASQLILGEQLKVTSVLTGIGDKAVNGVKPLTRIVDDFDSDSIPANITGALPITQIEQSVAEAKTQFTKEVPAATKTKLAALTGIASDAVDDFNQVVISAGFPEAVAKAVESVADDIKPADLQKAAAKLVEPAKIVLDDVLKPTFLSDVDNPQQIVDAVAKTLDDVLGSAISPDLKKGFSKLKSSLATTAITPPSIRVDFGFGSTIENIIEDMLNPAQNIISSIAFRNGNPTDVKPADISEIIKKAVVEKNVKKAAQIAAKYSDKPIKDIETAIGGIDNRLTTQTQEPAVIEVNASDITTAGSLWPDDELEVPPAEYWYNNLAYRVGGNIQQFKSEIVNANREITTLIVCATGVGSDVTMTARDVNERVGGTGRRNSPIHYFITKKGRIERIRPINIQAAPIADLSNDHHLRTVLVMMDGGLIGPQREEDETYGREGYNLKTWQAFDKMLETFFAVLPGLQVVGLNQIGNFESPYFNVSEYARTKFQKELLYDPKEEEPLTALEIVEGGTP